MAVLSYLITMLSILFFIVRGVIAVCYSTGTNIGITPINPTIEIILLFVTVICILLIIKRNIWGALVYFISYGLYFGNHLYQCILKISFDEMSIYNISFYLSFLGVLIPLLTVIDILFNKERKGNTDDPKTDWYYKNNKYERKHDDRADENQYKF